MDAIFGGFDNLADWAMAVADRNRSANLSADSLELCDYAVAWHLATGTTYAEMGMEMKTLRYRSKERYLDRVIMPRFHQMATEQRAGIAATVEATLSL